VNKTLQNQLWHFNRLKQIDSENSLCTYARVQLQEMNNIDWITHHSDTIITSLCDFSFIWQHIADMIFELSSFLSFWVLLWRLGPQEKKFKRKMMLSESKLILKIGQWEKSKRVHVQLLPWRVFKVLSNRFQRANGTYLGLS